jgi:mercuric ion binding protein
MIHHKTAAAVLSTALLLGAAASAAERTVTLAIDNMSCVTCPYIVQASLSAVACVRKVEVSYADRTAVVTFEDTMASVDSLTQATTEVGFPSRLAGQGS